MVFKANEEAAVDENINRKGRRPAKANKTTNRLQRERELSMLLRKFRPHVADAIMEASRILKNNQAGAHNQLKAATIILDNYRKLTIDIYGPEYDGEVEPEAGEEKEATPVFSLKVVGE